MSTFENEPVPYGWKKEWDNNYKQFFFVDTKADPPRSIWTHPYEDEQYLREHPDVREKVSSRRKSEFAAPTGPPPADGPSSTPKLGRTNSDTTKRGFLGKIKDKAIGTKEEREARRRYEEEQMRRAQEAQRQRQQQRQQQYLNQSRMQGGYYQQTYPQQGYQQYPQQYPQQGYAQYQQAPQQGRSRLGGGMALPLLGGLAGGLLLGEAFDGGDGGGDFGGGGFDGGGDFGGGDFGGGDF